MNELLLHDIGSFFPCACIAYRDMKHLESSESTQRKSQNDRPSSEIPQESRANLRVPGEFLTLRVAQFVLKIVNLAFSMEPRGPRACALLPRLWLLEDVYFSSWTVLLIR